MTYRLQTALAVSGIPRASFNTWRLRGQLPIKSPRGRWTDFTFADLCVLRTFARLHEGGIAIDVAAKIARDGVSQFTLADGVELTIDLDAIQTECLERLSRIAPLELPALLVPNVSG